MGVFMFMCVNAHTSCECVCGLRVHVRALYVNFRHSYYTPTDGIAKCYTSLQGSGIKKTTIKDMLTPFTLTITLLFDVCGKIF